MFDILANIYHDDPLSLDLVCSLENPECASALKLKNQLRAVDEKVAEALIPSIEDLADHQAEQAFYSGVRFGAQLMAELLKEV